MTGRPSGEANAWERRLALLVALYVYMGSLMFSYVYLVSPNFAYQGFVFEVPDSFWLQPATWLIAGLPCLWLPVSIRRPSMVVNWLLYICAYVPICMFPQYTVTTDPLVILQFDLVLMASFYAMGLHHKLPLLTPRFTNRDGFLFWGVVFYTSVLLYSLIFVTFGFNLRTVALDAVYEVRDDYKAAISNGGALVPYAISWQANVLNVLLMSYGLVNRRPVPLCAGLMGQLYIYTIGGFKSILFSSVIVAALYMAITYRPRSFGLCALWGTAATVVASTLLDLSQGTLTLTSIVVRRTFVAPGLLTGYYLDFFSKNPLVFLSDSVLRFAVPYPYSLSVPNTIGLIYFNNANSHVNANLWAHGYANFGLAGVMLFSVILSVLCFAYDSVASARDFKLAVLILSVPSVCLANTSLFTTILSHGLWLTFAVLVGLPGRSPPGGLRRARPPGG